MSLAAILIIILALGMIIGGIIVLKKSAKKFNLTPQQLKKINARNLEQEMLDKKTKR